MTNVYKAARSYGLSILLIAAFSLEGAKAPIAFAIWGTLVVILAAFVLIGHPERIFTRTLAGEASLLFFLFLSQCYAKDFSNSLFWTSQWLLFLLLWAVLKTNPELLEKKELFWRLSVFVGLIGAITTGMQWSRGNTAYGFLPINNCFNATWMACLSVALLARVQMRDPPRPRLWQAFEFFLAAGLGLMVVTGSSRNALLVLAIGLIYAVGPYLTARRAIMGLAFLTVSLALVPGEVLMSRFRFQDGYRHKIWAVALKAVRDRPFMGSGPGNFEMAYMRYAFPVETDEVRFSRTTSFAHNEYFQIASETGFPALIFVASGLLMLLFRSKVNPSQRPAYAAFLMMSIAAVNNIVWHMPFLVFMTLVWAVMIWHGQGHSVQASRSMPPKRCRWHVPAIMAGLCLIELMVLWQGVRDAWVRQGRWDCIIRFNPKDARAWQAWAYEQTDPAVALRGFQEAMTLAPEDLYLRESFGRALEASGRSTDLPLAILQYETALNLAPNRAINALALGRIQFRIGKPQQALYWFEKARRIEPRYWEADLWIARCYDALGDRRRATYVLKQLPLRRDQYLARRKKFQTDYLSSDYSRAILAYDPLVVARQLAQWRS